MATIKPWYKISFDRKRTKTEITLNGLREMYFERCINRLDRLFIIYGLPFPQHELNFRAYIDGYCGVVNDRKCGIMASWGGMSGVTQYSDVFKFFTYSAPTAKGGTAVIGKDAVILRNTPTLYSAYMWLMRYADLYAHNDISLRMALINSRYQDILKTTDESKRETLENWYRGLYEGDLLALIDDSPLSELTGDNGTISALDLNRTQEIDYTRYTELENELTRSFYRDIGIRWNKDKKANLVSGEVEQDNMMLEFNVLDMKVSRETFCEEYNKTFKDIAEPIKVALAIPLERNGENEQEMDNREVSGQDE